MNHEIGICLPQIKAYITTIFRDIVQVISNLIKSFTDANLSPLRSKRGTALIPFFNSDTGKETWPAKSSLPTSESLTSILRTASSGTVNGKLNSSFQTGVQESSTFFVLNVTASLGAPKTPIYIYIYIHTNQ